MNILRFSVFSLLVLCLFSCNRVAENGACCLQVICVYICGHAYGWGPIGWLYPT